MWLTIMVIIRASFFLAIQKKKKIKPSLAIWLNLRILEQNIRQFKHMQIVRIGNECIKEIEKTRQCAILTKTNKIRNQLPNAHSILIPTSKHSYRIWTPISTKTLPMYNNNVLEPIIHPNPTPKQKSNFKQQSKKHPQELKTWSYPAPLGYIPYLSNTRACHIDLLRYQSKLFYND